VFVPTIFAILAQFRRLGTGSEFQGTECWYLPTRKQKPVQRVLEYWFRTAGLQTPYGLSKRVGRKQKDPESQVGGVKFESLKHRAKRWLNGEANPSPQDLEAFVDEIAQETSWLDRGAVWKARFVLASAIQNAGDEADAFFKSVRRNPSIRLSEIFGKVVDKPDFCDVDRFLAQPHTYFASRLIQQRMRQTGELKRIQKAIPKQMEGHPRDDSEFDSDRWRENA